MITTLLLCFIFLGPGLLIGAWLKVDNLRLPHALLYSYATYFVSFYFVALMGWPGERVIDIQIGQSIILFGILLYSGRVGSLVWVLNIDFKSSRQHGIPEIVVGTVAIVWLASVGPYLEIPTDVFEHLSKITDIREDLKHGAFGTTFPWYSAVAVALSYSGESVGQIIAPLSIAMTVIFLFSVVSLTRAITGPLALSRVVVLMSLVASPIFTLLMFGTSVFSYLRYYVFAPAFLVYLIYLLAGFVVIDLVVNQRPPRRLVVPVITVVLGVLVSYTVHRQEALFIIALAGAGVAYAALGALLCATRVEGGKSTMALGVWRTVGIVGIPVVLFLAVFLKLSGSQPEPTLLINNVIDLGRAIGLDRQLLIADPRGRAFETLGLGGLIIIASYFLLIPGDKRSIFLSISILTPVLIIFNPLTVGLFLSVSKQEVLWRFMFMTPIGMVAGYLFAFLVSQGKSQKYLKRNVIIGIVLLVPWIPFQRAHDVLQQRYSTLTEIPSLQDIRLLSDLAEEVNKHAGRDVLTDPVTGYVFGAMTQNRYTGFKFHHSGDHIDLNKNQYSSDSFSGFKSRLVIINLRYNS